MNLIETAIHKAADLPKDVCEDGIHYVCGDCVNEIKNKERKANEDQLK